MPLVWDGAAGGTMTRSDVECGLHGGFEGGGFAETSIRRSQFLRNSKAGVSRELQRARSGTRCSKTAARARRTRPERERIMSIMSSSGVRCVPTWRWAIRGGFSARGNYSIGSSGLRIATSTWIQSAYTHSDSGTDPNRIYRQSAKSRVGRQARPRVRSDPSRESHPRASPS